MSTRSTRIPYPSLSGVSTRSPITCQSPQNSTAGLFDDSIQYRHMESRLRDANNNQRGSLQSFSESRISRNVPLQPGLQIRRPRGHLRTFGGDNPSSSASARMFHNSSYDGNEILQPRPSMTRSRHGRGPGDRAYPPVSGLEYGRVIRTPSPWSPRLAYPASDPHSFHMSRRATGGPKPPSPLHREKYQINSGNSSGSLAGLPASSPLSSQGSQSTGFEVRRQGPDAENWKGKAPSIVKPPTTPYHDYSEAFEDPDRHLSDYMKPHSTVPKRPIPKKRTKGLSEISTRIPPPLKPTRQEIRMSKDGNHHDRGQEREKVVDKSAATKKPGQDDMNGQRTDALPGDWKGPATKQLKASRATDTTIGRGRPGTTILPKDLIITKGQFSVNSSVQENPTTRLPRLKRGLQSVSGDISTLEAGEWRNDEQQPRKTKHANVSVKSPAPERPISAQSQERFSRILSIDDEHLATTILDTATEPDRRVSKCPHGHSNQGQTRTRSNMVGEGSVDVRQHPIPDPRVYSDNIQSDKSEDWDSEPPTQDNHRPTSSSSVGQSHGKVEAFHRGIGSTTKSSNSSIYEQSSQYDSENQQSQGSVATESQLGFARGLQPLSHSGPEEVVPRQSGYSFREVSAIPLVERSKFEKRFSRVPPHIPQVESRRVSLASHYSKDQNTNDDFNESGIQSLQSEPSSIQDMGSTTPSFQLGERRDSTSTIVPLRRSAQTSSLRRETSILGTSVRKPLFRFKGKSSSGSGDSLKVSSKAPQIDLKPPSPTMGLGDTRSFFSVDSSTISHSERSMKKGHSLLRSRTLRGGSAASARPLLDGKTSNRASKATRKDGRVPTEEQHMNSEIGRTHSTSAFKHASRKFQRRMQHLWQRGRARLRALGDKMKNGKTGQVTKG